MAAATVSARNGGPRLTAEPGLTCQSRVWLSLPAPCFRGTYTPSGQLLNQTRNWPPLPSSCSWPVDCGASARPALPAVMSHSSVTSHSSGTSHRGQGYSAICCRADRTHRAEEGETTVRAGMTSKPLHSRCCTPASFLWGPLTPIARLGSASELGV